MEDENQTTHSRFVLSLAENAFDGDIHQEPHFVQFLPGSLKTDCAFLPVVSTSNPVSQQHQNKAT